MTDLLLRINQPWRDRALCAQVGGDLWFPEKGASTREAKQICRQCPVQTECLLEALRTNQRYGIWGGISERQRRDMVRGAL